MTKKGQKSTKKRPKEKTVPVKGTITKTQRDVIRSLVGTLGSNQQDVIGKIIVLWLYNEGFLKEKTKKEGDNN